MIISAKGIEAYIKGLLQFPFLRLLRSSLDSRFTQNSGNLFPLKFIDLFFPGVSIANTFMLNTSQLNSNEMFPFAQIAQTGSTEEKARQLHRLLLDLSKDESEKELRYAIRQTSDFFREKYFGLTERQIKTRILEVMKDYFDGEEYRGLEIDNLAEQTGIKESQLLPVVKAMVAGGILLEGRRRRWQEPGKHYNSIYKLKA